MHVRNERVPRPSPGRGGGEEEGATLLKSQAAANVGGGAQRRPVQSRARSSDFAASPGQGWASAGTQSEGKGLRCDPDPRAAPGLSGVPAAASASRVHRSALPYLAGAPGPAEGRASVQFTQGRKE